MDEFAQLLSEFLESEPVARKPFDYLSMKRGSIPLQVGYNENPEPSQHLPTIQIQNNQNYVHF